MLPTTDKAVIISGMLVHLSDNIIPFLDKRTDVYCHTWNVEQNTRWITKLNRYKKYCRSITIEVDEPIFEEKRLSYFFSTYRAVNMITDIDGYSSILKFKPNVEGPINYIGNLPSYFNKAFLQSRPLLLGITKEDCLYGSVYYQTLDERMFTGYSLAFKKMFYILEEEFIQKMNIVNYTVKLAYGDNCEGSLFWMEWANQRKVKLIQDTDLKIPNSKSYG
jgi:hypothetical protein